MDSCLRHILASDYPSLQQHGALVDFIFQAITLIIQGTRKASQNHVGRSALRLTTRVCADNK